MVGSRSERATGTGYVYIHQRMKFLVGLLKSIYFPKELKYIPLYLFREMSVLKQP